MEHKHFEKLFDLIEVEREAEKEENRQKLEKYPIHVREALGKTITRLTIEDEDVGVGGMPLLIFSHPRSALREGLSPFHAINQGDNVLVTYPESTGLKPVDGTLYDVKDFYVTVAINGAIPNPLPKGQCQLDMLGSDATYKRMKQALKKIDRTGQDDLVRLRRICLGEEKPKSSKSTKLELFNDKLNKYQVEAVNKCLAANDVALVHGPPGTGKTTVLVEIILQSIKRGERVLASAPSNVAVDNMVEKLLPYTDRIVRLGHPARILESLRHVTLDAQQEEHESYEQIRMMDAERHRMITQLKRKKDRNRNSTYQERRELETYISQLWKESKNLEFTIRRQIIQQSDVVLSTHGGLSPQFAKQRFDLIVLDEASQATEPLSWIPMTLGKKVIFAGDSFQLPPTIYSQEANIKGLGVTIFDRLKESLPAKLQSLLRIQYRMHKHIMGFSSKNFYDNKLIADKSVAAHTASELKGVQPSELLEEPVLFIDTAGTGYEETWNELLESRENEGEAGLCVKVLDVLRQSNIEPEQIALITPYMAQVKKLRSQCSERGLEIGSIDSFQGREKEVIILSLVRSNDKGEVGFLSDVRRMNVGMTRARRLLVVIGDSSTIGQHKFYKGFLDYVEKLDAHKSAWEWKDD